MIVSMKELLVAARKESYAVVAFEFWSLDSAQAIVEAAEEAKMPVILQTGPLEIEFAGIKNLSKIARMVAEQSFIKVAIHLDHGNSFEMAKEAIDNGFTSVMIDASALPYSENVSLTRKIVDIAKPSSVTVESELGKLAGNETGINISEEEQLQTDPDEAEKFVEETGIDALAVAIGTAHGFYKFKPQINFERLKKINEKVKIPLVLHGGSGVPNKQIREAIKLGIAKVNICTDFIAAFGKAYIREQNKPEFQYNVPSLFGAAKEAGRKLALEKIKLCAGKYEQEKI